VGRSFERWNLSLAALLLSASLLAAPESRAGLTVVAPRDGAILDAATVTLAGTVDGGGGSSVKIMVNGGGIPAVPVEGGGFSARITLRPGTNRVALRSGAENGNVTYEYREGAGTYRFHGGYGEGECEECHAGLLRKGGDGGLCHSCHDRKDGARFLHGPVGAGQCTSCHDPHGSPYGHFTTAPGRSLCAGCHDQPSSREHLEAASGGSCESCHNPHGSDRKFFLR
jgi:predicted CXXCH cytochrome family protein